jgi:hypothetical protein
MNSRTTALKDIRPVLSHILKQSSMTADESFQNETLRPILKFQNELLIAVFHNYIEKHKGTFYDLDAVRKMGYIEQSIQKDVKLRNALKGMIIGQFTIEEYEIYIKNSSALNKRMMGMVTERIKDHVQLLEKTVNT